MDVTPEAAAAWIARCAEQAPADVEAPPAPAAAPPAPTARVRRRWETEELLGPGGLARREPWTLMLLASPAAWGDSDGPYALGVPNARLERATFLDPTATGATAVRPGTAPDDAVAAPLRGLNPGEPNPWGLTAAAHLAWVQNEWGHARPASPPGSFGAGVVTCVVPVDGAWPAPLAGSLRSAVDHALRAFEDRGWTGREVEARAVDVAPWWNADARGIELIVTQREAHRRDPVAGCAPCAAESLSCACAYTGTVTAAHLVLRGGAIEEVSLFAPRAATHSVAGGRIESPW